jgi:hypothetical protein
MQSKPRGCRYFFNLGGFTLFALFLGFLVFQFILHPFILSDAWAHPTRVSLEAYTPRDFGLRYEDVELHTQDNLTLRGWYLPSQNGASVILLHSIGANRLGTMNHARMLQDDGYGVLMFDLRAHGESDGEILPFGGPEAYDVIAAVDYLQAREELNPEQIAAMGLSLGTNFAILGASADGRVRAVVSEGTGGTVPSDLGPQSLIYQIYDPIFFSILNWRTGVSEPRSIGDAVESLTVPIFFIGTPSEEAAAQSFAARNERSSLWIVPNSVHIGGISHPDYAGRVIGFLDTALGITRE